MFRLLLIVFGALVIGSVALYFLTRKARYLAWARRILYTGMALGLLVGTVMLLRLVIKGLS